MKAYICNKIQKEEKEKRETNGPKTCLIFKVLMNATIIEKLIVQGHKKANIILNESAISSFYAADSFFSFQFFKTIEHLHQKSQFCHWYVQVIPRPHPELLLI